MPGEHSSDSIDLRPTAAVEQFRLEAREWLRAHRPASLPSGDTLAGVAANLEWERQLFDAGWAVVSWPAAYGGRDASIWEWLAFEDEYYGAGLPQRVAHNGLSLLAPALFEFGTPEQRERYLRPMASVEELWCQGWSEPDSGSDLASIRSRAERDERAGGWRLYGQKTWTTRGALCSRLFGLFRTDPTAERHRGLSYLLVDLRQEGVTVHPMARLDGDDAAFAEVFFDGAFVADADVLGPVGQGWQVAMSTTASERGVTLRSPGRFAAAAARLVDLFHARGGDASVRRAVARAWADVETYRLATFAMATAISDGSPVGAESSLSKVFWSEMDVHLHETALALLGEEAGLDGAWMKGFEFALAGPIYAGTNEIQRNVIAERLLGLPRR